MKTKKILLTLIVALLLGFILVNYFDWLFGILLFVPPIIVGMIKDKGWQSLDIQLKKETYHLLTFIGLITLFSCLTLSTIPGATSGKPLDLVNGIFFMSCLLMTAIIFRRFMSKKYLNDFFNASVINTNNNTTRK